MSAIRVFVVEDHAVVRMGVRKLLERENDMVVVGEASSGEQALRLAGQLRPDIVLLDVGLPDMPGEEVARRMRAANPSIKILALSGYDDFVFAQEMIQAGAVGYLMKEEEPESILSAVRGAAKGETGWISRKITARLISFDDNRREASARLSGRERQVLRLMAQGYPNQKIANEMGISEKTVEKYIESILLKTGAATRVEAAVWAVKNGLA